MATVEKTLSGASVLEWKNAAEAEPSCHEGLGQAPRAKPAHSLLSGLGADWGTRYRMPRTAAWFLIRRFLEPFLCAISAFTILDLLADFIDRFDDLAHYGLLTSAGIQYLFLKIPLEMSQLLPVACLAGMLIGLGMLNRDGELLALQGLGISRVAISAPLLVVAALVSLFNFGLNETIVPVATRRAKYLLNIEIRNEQNQSVYIGRWLRTRNGFVSVSNYDPVNHRLFQLTIFRTDSAYNLRAIYRAKSALWNGHRWLYSGLQELRMHDGHVQTRLGVMPTLEFQPQDLVVPLLDPDSFGLSELNAYIRKLRRSGLDPGAYLVDRDVKYAMPLSCLILGACGIVLSLDPVPRRASLGRGFILGFGIGLFYWVALGFTVSFGRSGLIPAWSAAWLPNLVFSLVAVSMFLFGEER